MKEGAKRKIFSGIVVSDKMDKTRIVKVTRTINHPVFGRVIKRSKRFSADDRKNESHTGDMVTIMETRPLSKTKRWRIVKVQ